MAKTNQIEKTKNTLNFYGCDSPKKADMRAVKSRVHAIVLLFAIILITLSSACDGSIPLPPGLTQQAIQLSGWLTTKWPDGPPGTEIAPPPVYLLNTDSGFVTELDIDPATVSEMISLLRSLDRQHVDVGGLSDETNAATSGKLIQAQEEPVPETLTLTSISASPDPKGLSLSLPRIMSEALTVMPAVNNSQSWISILCRFSDNTTTPLPTSFFSDMYGDTAPRLGHYWREASYNTINLNGSRALGWYTLPQPRSAYIKQNRLNFDLLARDCTAAADSEVNFAGFIGINLMFNDELDGMAWGGSHTLTLDGITKPWNMTWMPPWGYKNLATMAHEMGHGFGLPHSSGTYNKTYDNQWDVMSDTWSNGDRSKDNTYGILPQHTISFHKDFLGWIAPERKYTALAGLRGTITIERLAQPALEAGAYLMAQIPIGGSNTHFYTVEVRGWAGYDVKLPGEGVIIHEVDLTRERPANVIDNDKNGNTGDQGAIWTSGEVFSDTNNKITVAIDAQQQNGYRVTIQNGDTTARRSTLDFNGDGKMDVVVFRSGEWFIKDQGYSSVFGQAGDIPVPGDYNADGKTEMAVYRKGLWYIKDQGEAILWGGNAGDIPLPGDYDGDGRTDIAIYRQGRWYIRGEADGIGWGGLPADIPVPADYNGDNRLDIAIYRAGVWYIRGLGDPFIWRGNAVEIPVPADYNGDAKAEAAVFYNGVWYIRGYAAPVNWGEGTQDVPVPGDYNGDGRAEIAVFRNGWWYIKDMGDAFNWGDQPGDIPLSSLPTNKK